MNQIRQFGDCKVLVLDGLGHEFAASTLANDLIGLAWEHEAQIVAMPMDELAGQFFDLRSGVLGEMTQKFANYRLHLAIVGDVSAYMGSSKAFRDYVYEANKGRTLWFVANLAELERRLLDDRI